MVTTNKQKRNAFLLGILIVLFYMAGRTFIAQLIPVEGSWAKYLKQDAVITLLRLLGLICIYWVSRKVWSLKELGSHTQGKKIALVIGVILLAAYFIQHLAYVVNSDTSYYFVISEVFILVIVACFEELTFRGLFYNALREMKNERWAEYITSILFMLFHMGYYSFNFGEFSRIFMTGLIFAKLRSRGCSLYWLILIHWAIDVLWVIQSPGQWIQDRSYMNLISWALMFMALLTFRIFPKKTEGVLQENG